MDSTAQALANLERMQREAREIGREAGSVSDEDRRWTLTAQLRELAEDPAAWATPQDGWRELLFQFAEGFAEARGASFRPGGS